MPEETIGIIGVGAMGSWMSRRLVAAGREVWVHDISDEAVAAAVESGARRAGSVAAVARRATVVLLSLSTPQVVREVVLGPGGLVETGGFDCLIDHSTSGLEAARDIARGLSRVGIESIDAPVSGGVRGAETGSLTIMVSADAAVVERRRPILEIIGSKIFHVGNEPGQGQVMKLANNMISSVAMVATAEGMVLGVKAGLDPAVMLDVLNASTGRNSHTEDKFPRYVLPRTFDFGFSMGLLHKDVLLGLQMAETLAVPMIATGAANQVWNVALAEGGPEQDMTALVRSIEQWAGVEVASRPAIVEVDGAARVQQVGRNSR